MDAQITHSSSLSFYFDCFAIGKSIDFFTEARVVLSVCLSLSRNRVVCHCCIARDVLAVECERKNLPKVKCIAREWHMHKVVLLIFPASLLSGFGELF